MSALGQSLPRIDAPGKVTGATEYSGDIDMPGALWSKILFAGRPHARIKSMDTAAALALPGVVTIYSAADVPRNEYGMVVADQPVLCGLGGDNPAADTVRFTGDQVALIVADTEAQGAAARDAIEIEWEDLPVLSDPRVAMRPGAPAILPGCPDNVLASRGVRRGDVDAAWAQCDAIVEGYYETPMQEHAYLQPEAGIAYIDEQGRVTVAVAGQWAHEEQRQIAHALKLSPEQVRVIHPAIGGAFGGREDLSIQIVLALAAFKLKRPVRMIWSREESIIGHHKRHAFYIHMKWGARADGMLLAAECDMTSDCGAYAYTSPDVLGNAMYNVTGPYVIPNVRVDGRTVVTNNVPGGAFRGFGGPQGAFAAEMQMNKLAEKLGLDPVAFRRKNVLTDGAISSSGSPFPRGVSIDTVIEACAREAGWGAPAARPANPNIRRGRGFACAFKNIGFSFGFPERCVATIELRGASQIEEAILYHAGSDVGQGAHTVFVQMAAQALGLPVDKVRLVAGDTASSGDSGSSSASRMTALAGNSIIGAAGIALQKWQAEERPAIGTFRYTPPATTHPDVATGAGIPFFAVGYVAQAVEVEVDIGTGQVRLLDVICADDVGRAVNPQQVIGQIEGAVIQAAGYALMENLILRDGRILTPHLSSYLIPTVLDIPPRVRSVVLEVPDEVGPWGARGMSEMPMLPLAPAIAAAIKDATGVWIDAFPYTPDRVRAALNAA